MGFSQNTWAPASRAAMVSSAWRQFSVHTLTMSGFTSRSMAW